MTAFDYAVLAVLGLSLLLGVWRGLASEVLALAAWIVAFLAGKMLAPEMAPLFGEWIREPAFRYAAAFGVIAVLVLAVAAIARLLLSKLLRAVGLGPLDRFLGAAFGVARGGLIVMLLVLIGGMTTQPQEAWWREAKLAPPLETAVLAARTWLPPALAKRIRYR